MKFNFRNILGPLLLLSCIASFSQKVSWDDSQAKKWPEATCKVEIRSTFDGSLQPAVAFKAQAANRPLLISLHTWSGDYTQEDSLVIQAIEEDYNYIHPNFRGANNTPAACASDAAIQDVEDAIKYGVQSLGADPKEIHVIGVSGGGYMTMMCYMRIKTPVKSFSSWVGISDLESWYYESIGRKQKYAQDILNCLGAGTVFNGTAARERSPVFQDRSVQKGTLHLYAGIHDGYQGSVPVSQTLHFYNRVVTDLFPKELASKISESEMNEILASQTSRISYPEKLGNRTVHLVRRKGPVSVTIFEGKHEMVIPVALQLVPIGSSDIFKTMHIVGIGDSNGANENGWISQLRKSLPWTTVLNYCKPGRTIGFDNNGDTTLNALKLIKDQLKDAAEKFDNKVDWVVLALGTNDAKNIFDGREVEVVQNFQKLFAQLITFRDRMQPGCRIMVVLPPPVSTHAATTGKYEGAEERLTFFGKNFRDIAKQAGAVVVDSYNLFLNEKDTFTVDGIHLNEESQAKWARQMIRQMRGQ